MKGMHDLETLTRLIEAGEIDAVLRERLGVLAKPQPFQPCANIIRHNRLILAWDAAKLTWSGAVNPSVRLVAPNVCFGSRLCENSEIYH